MSDLDVAFTPLRFKSLVDLVSKFRENILVRNIRGYIRVEERGCSLKTDILTAF